MADDGIFAGALVLHALSTFAMFGVIWFVQVVHYPLFDHADRGSFRSFAALHGRYTSLVVVPLMLTELGSALVLVWQHPQALPGTALWLGLALLAVIWVSTFILQVPAHRRLADGFDAAAHGRLVHTNWIRTAAWTARAALVGWLLWRSIPGP